MTVEREIFRSAAGLIVRGVDGGAVQFTTVDTTATLSTTEFTALVEALRQWVARPAADDDEHLPRVARLSSAAIG
jgi:hypothetical protein